MHIADRWTESFHAKEMLLIPQTNFAVSLTLKLELSLNVTYYPPPALWQKQALKKSEFKIAPCKTSVCDPCMCKDLLRLKQNCTRSLRHKITRQACTRVDTRTHKLIRLYPVKHSFCGSYDKHKGCCTAYEQTIHGFAKLAQSSQAWHL